MFSLATFIRENSAPILSEWEVFARSIPLGAEMSRRSLRDHARAMLEVIATDLETPQTEREQSDKSKGLAEVDRRLVTAAADHGSERAEGGFSVVEMVAEFRALRASVVRLWTQQERTLGAAELEELIRFNEAIDQALAESLARYSRAIDETRERFLAVLGHDLRSPLGAIVTSTRFLQEVGGLTPEQTLLIGGVESAGRRMNQLVGDLLELALNRLGDGMPIARSTVDVGATVASVVAEVRASYPKARIESSAKGDLTADVDGARVAQALTNLVANAVQHGDAASPISVAAHSDEADIIIAVHNRGAPIPPEELGGIFEGMKRGAAGNRDRRHLGLGLFIVDKIVGAHGGDIAIDSSAAEGTTFTVRLPKRPPTQVNQ